MRRFILILSTLVICLIFSTDTFASDFTIEDVLLQAQEEDKHIFMRFTASWCLPCQMLDEELANHPDIVKEINSIYISIELDYDEPNHREWFVRYGIQCLPTMMVIDDMGQIKDKMDGTESISGLASFLHTNAKHPTDKLVYKELSNVTTNKTENQRTKKKVEPTRKIFYSSDFSIQFGAFGSYENAQKLSNILISQENINTIIIEESTNGKTMYKVRQTNFSEDKTGDDYVRFYKKMGIECMLKKV